MTMIDAAIEELAGEAEALFARIAAATGDEYGITRDAFGAKETQAGDILMEFARQNGLEAFYDGVGNLNVVRGSEVPGQEILFGSHIDSVPAGGNFDGLAGVIAGLIVLSALQHRGIKCRYGLRTIGFRGEESPWFGTAYLGSKLFLAQLTREELETLRRFDTGGTLWEHLEQLGLTPENHLDRPQIEPESIRAYFELHIEQAPLLLSLDQPVAIANAIRGNIRYPGARCFGSYAHSGAVPRHLRSDAVIAVARLLAHADAEWKKLIEAGADDLVFTCGIFQTDARNHAMTKVPGQVTFSLNIGGTDDAVMDRLHESIMACAQTLSRDHGVRFEFGERVGTPAVALDPTLMAAAIEAAQGISVPLTVMPTVGHDAAMFARRGVPSAVVLLRNANGSHNPAESMEISDFMLGTRILARTALSL